MGVCGVSRLGVALPAQCLKRTQRNRPNPHRQEHQRGKSPQLLSGHALHRSVAARLEPTRRASCEVTFHGISQLPAALPPAKCTFARRSQGNLQRQFQTIDCTRLQRRVAPRSRVVRILAGFAIVIHTNTMVPTVITPMKNPMPSEARRLLFDLLVGCFDNNSGSLMSRLRLGGGGGRWRQLVLPPDRPRAPHVVNRRIDGQFHE